jgi:hypothetical protein
MKSQAEKGVARPAEPCIGFCHVHSLTHCAREEVPELLSNTQPVEAATRSLAGLGAGALLCDGVRVGSPVSCVAAARVLPRVRRTPAVGNGSALAGAGNQAITHKQFNQTARISPAYPGGVGPHPVREPVPV